MTDYLRENFLTFFELKSSKNKQQFAHFCKHSLVIHNDILTIGFLLWVSIIRSHLAETCGFIKAGFD